MIDEINEKDFFDMEKYCSEYYKYIYTPYGPYARCIIEHSSKEPIDIRAIKAWFLEKDGWRYEVESSDNEYRYKITNVPVDEEDSIPFDEKD